MLKHKGKLFIFALFCLIIPFTAIYGQESSFSDNFAMGLFFGNEVVDGVVYNTFSLTPTLTFGLFSVGLDLYFEFDPDFNFRRDSEGNVVGWSTWQDYINKILFIQYGEKGDPLYGKLGLIDDATLGHGLIMQNYTNALYFPEIRKTGFAFDLDGALFNFPYVGMESFIDDVKDPDIIGLRLYARPLLFLNIPIISYLRVGYTFVTDTDPQATEAYTDSSGSSSVTVSGIDFDVPVLSAELASVLLYCDFASIKDQGSGMKFGASGLFLKIIGFGAEILSYGDHFVGTYFDQLYENLGIRNTKFASLDSVTGYTGWRVFTYLTVLQDIFTTYAEVSGAFNDDSTKPYFIGAISLNEGLIPMVSFNFIIIRTDISQFSDLWNWSDPNLLLNSYLRFEIKLQPGTMTSVSLIYEVKYELDGSEVVKVATSYFTTGIEF